MLLRQDHPACSRSSPWTRTAAYAKKPSAPGRLGPDGLPPRCWRCAATTGPNPSDAVARGGLMWRLDYDRGCCRRADCRPAARASHAPRASPRRARDADARAHARAASRARPRPGRLTRLPPLRRFGHELTRGLGIADDKELLRIALRGRDHACRAAAMARVAPPAAGEAPRPGGSGAAACRRRGCARARRRGRCRR
ncbi:hypothetical protein ACU686_29020 [Yinghuangia aomiensis]